MQATHEQIEELLRYAKQTDAPVDIFHGTEYARTIGNVVSAIGDRCSIRDRANNITKIMYRDITLIGAAIEVPFNAVP